MFPHTVTLYDSYTEEDGSMVWCRTILKSVLFVTNILKHYGVNGDTENDICNVTIPLNLGLPKKYISPIEYSKLSEEDKQKNYFTIKPDDIIIKGAVDLDELEYSVIRSTYDDCYKVTQSVVNDFGGLKHIYISAN